MKHLDLNTIKLPVIIREPISLKAIIRKFMVVDNCEPMQLFYKKSLVKNNGVHLLKVKFKNK